MPFAESGELTAGGLPPSVLKVRAARRASERGLAARVCLSLREFLVLTAFVGLWVRDWGTGFDLLWVVVAALLYGASRAAADWHTSWQSRCDVGFDSFVILTFWGYAATLFVNILMGLAETG